MEFLGDMVHGTHGGGKAVHGRRAGVLVTDRRPTVERGDGKADFRSLGCHCLQVRTFDHNIDFENAGRTRKPVRGIQSRAMVDIESLRPSAFLLCPTSPSQMLLVTSLPSMILQP